MDPKLSLPTCRQADNGAMWMLENLLELPGTAEESSFFEKGALRNDSQYYPTNVRRPAYQRVQGVRNVVGRSEKDVCIGRELGGNATRSPG